MQEIANSIFNLLSAQRANIFVGNESNSNQVIDPLEQPGRPNKPILVAPRELKQRNLNSIEGRQALMHAVAHIEFNAINLALDAVYRFRDLPIDFYLDWLRVAADEARHFIMVKNRLNQLGKDYGDFPAHNGLWEMAIKTRDDVIARMALVPRVLEARGLDVTPGLIERLRAVKDEDSAAVLAIILREEVAHVAYGSKWLDFLCRQKNLDSTTEFLKLAQQHTRGAIRGPYNNSARLEAGFTQAELDALAATN